MAKAAREGQLQIVETALGGLDRSGSTSRIFGPALVGAAMQLGAVAVPTAGFYILARYADFRQLWLLTLCEPGTSCSAATYLVQAIHKRMRDD